MYTVGNETNGIQLVPHTPEYCIQLFRVVPKGSVVPCAARVFGVNKVSVGVNTCIA
jgi:hypothetical protein